MGVLTEIFVGNDVIARNHCGGGDWQGAPDEIWQAKGITFLEISTLWAILDGQPWDESRIEPFDDLSDEDDEEATTFRFPGDLVRRLATMDDPSLEVAAVSWASTEELSLSSFDVADTRLQFLVHAAKRVKQDGRCLYIWTCA